MSVGPDDAEPSYPDLRADPQACQVRKLAVAVTVAFATADGIVETLEGDVRHLAGDAILTGVKGERWPVPQDVFAKSYVPVPPTQPGQPGAYVKRLATAVALQLRSAMSVPVGRHDNWLHGRPGDWLLQYEDGSHGVVCDTIFRATYARISPDL